MHPLWTALAVAQLWLASDMDKTLAFYDNDTQQEGRTVVALPASSGTGKVGYVGVKTLDLLAEIESVLPQRLVCVSGQRAATMLQRQAFFPMIKYWLCENGGRLFVRDNDDPTLLREDASFAERLFHAAHSAPASFSDACRALEDFGRELEKKRGAVVDTKGYATMLRVKLAAGDDDFSPQDLPAALSCTHNLGFLDVTLRGIDKASAIALLIAEKRSVGDDSPSEYLYFGDDDNDVGAAAASCEAYIAHEHSAAMRAWLRGQRTIVTVDCAVAETRATTAVDAPPPQTSSLPRFVALSAEPGPAGCAALLALALRRLRAE